MYATRHLEDVEIFQKLEDCNLQLAKDAAEAITLIAYRYRDRALHRDGLIECTCTWMAKAIQVTSDRAGKIYSFLEKLGLIERELRTFNRRLSPSKRTWLRPNLNRIAAIGLQAARILTAVGALSKQVSIPAETGVDTCLESASINKQELKNNIKKESVCVGHDHRFLENQEGQKKEEELSDRHLENQPELKETLQNSEDPLLDKCSAAPAEILDAIAPKLKQLSIDAGDRGLIARIGNLCALEGVTKAAEVLKASLDAIAAISAPRCPIALLKTAIAERGWAAPEQKRSAAPQTKPQSFSLDIPAAQLREFQETVKTYAAAQGYQNPGAYALKVLGNLEKGLHSDFLDAFLAGEPLGGIGIQREWEIAPGTPYPAFEEERIQYYIHKAGEPIEAATARARADLRNPVLGKDLWDGFLRKCDRLAEEGLKAQKLGVATPYLPPSFSDRAPVSKELVMGKLEAIAPSMQPQLPGGSKQVAEESVAVPTLEQLNRLYQSAIGRNLAENQIAQNPEWGYVVISGEVVEKPAPRTLKVRIEGMLNAGNYAKVLIGDLWRKLSEGDRVEARAVLMADERGRAIADALTGGGL